MTPVRAWTALARLRLLPGVLALPGLGWAWAHWDRALPVQSAESLPPLALCWALLHVGTMWLNAARDRDEGEVLLGEAVPVPRGTAALGGAALLGCAAVASALPGAVARWALVCVVLSVLYSHPRTAWKGHPVLGPLVNVVGYGLASPAAGVALVGLPPTRRTAAMAAVSMLSVLGAVFIAQAFQGEEDRRRGDRTLVARVGSAGTVRAARVAFAAAAAVSMSLAAVGWLPRLCLVAVPAWIGLDRHLVAMEMRPNAGGAEAAVQAGRQVVRVAVLGIALAFAQYAVDSWGGGPVAGLATAAGHPPLDGAWLARLTAR